MGVSRAYGWTFIGFDIEEPIYVVETKARGYRFVVGFLRDKVLIVDDLNGLPPL